MDKPEFSDLWCVVGQLLILTDHKQMAVDNLCQEMLIVQRIIQDHIISGGVMVCVEITKALMTSCQAGFVTC